MKVYRPLILLSLLLVASTASSADVQEFKISHNDNAWNIDMCLAAADNGNVLVVWTERNVENNDISNIWAVLCERGQKGTYKIRNRQMISSGVHFDDNADVAYNKDADNFLISFYRLVDLCTHTSHIHCRVVNNKGNPDGQIVDTIISDDSNVAPVLCYNEKGGTTDWGEKRFLLLWSRNRPRLNDTGRFGVWSIYVDGEGNWVTDDHQFHFSTWDDSIEYIMTYSGFVDHALQNDDGSFLVALNSKVVGTGKVDGYLYHLNQNGHLERKYIFDTDGDVLYMRLAKMKKNIFLCTWFMANVENWGSLHRRFKIVPSPKGKIHDAIPERDELQGEVLKLGQDKGAYFLGLSAGQFHGQYLKKTGKPKGDSEMIAGKAGSFRDMRAITIPGTNQIFVVWRNNLTGPNLTSDIRALIFDVEVPSRKK